MRIKRRDLSALAAGLPWTASSSSAPGRKRLRTAMEVSETGFDPPRVSDRTSVTINAHIFESPLTYDLLARPALLIPQTAAALPEISDGHRRFVFTLKPGIFFADDPAFGGKPRELVAEDYVYSIKRYYDPRMVTEHLYQFENLQILGLSELRRAAQAAKRGLDYDQPVAGLRALDRYRFELRLAKPAPRGIQLFAVPGLTGAVAREVVERYGDDILAHPVGTGPFKLAAWRRGSRVLLARNERFREQRFEASPPPDDAEAIAFAERLRGKRLPLVDEIEISIIQEDQPRWLAFHGGELDLIEMPSSLGALAWRGGLNGSLAPHLARRGVHGRAVVDASVRQTFFNTEDADIGGLSPARVALRRAIALGYDNRLELERVFQGKGLVAQSLLPPGVSGYDPALRSEQGAGDLARANALLDVYGYARRPGERWRSHPDGRPLLLRMAAIQDGRQRLINELWEQRMRALGLRIVFETGQFGELIKNSLAGRLQMWSFAWSTTLPDGDFFLGLAYGPNRSQANDARFALPAYDRLYERQAALPDGPERLALMQQAQRLMLAYTPYLAHSHALRVDLMQPGVDGYWRNVFTRDWWKTVSVGNEGMAAPLDARA